MRTPKVGDIIHWADDAWEPPAACAVYLCANSVMLKVNPSDYDDEVGSTWLNGEVIGSYKFVAIPKTAFILWNDKRWHLAEHHDQRVAKVV